MATFRKRGKYWEYRVKYTDSAGKQLVASRGGYRLKSSAQDAAEAVEDDFTWWRSIKTRRSVT